LSKQNLFLARYGEEEAVGLLKAHGYKILARNFKNRFGEIDIIAQDNGVISFIEVKTRRTTHFGTAFEAVSWVKQRKIAKVALSFLKENKLLDRKTRFDVVSIDASAKEPKTVLLKSAFELDERFAF
jgi:putative endonuclease